MCEAMTSIATSAVGYLDDEALVERIFDHLDRGTTDTCDEIWREPVEHYRSPMRFDRELDLVLRRRPIPLCPSAAIGEPGSYLARDVAGVPLVAIRGRDGVVRAFRNSCRHRGTAIVDGSGCAKSLACPYHGWVYRLDGTLHHVPDAYGFPQLDKASCGLVAVRAIEHGGVVFVDQAGEPDDLTPPSCPTDLIGADQTLIDANEATVDVNWKVLTDGFLEGYHLKATHRSTFLPFGYDNVTVVEHSGANTRVTFPFRRIEALRGVSPGDRCIDGCVTIVHHVFPNVIVAHLSHHTTMVVLEPLAVDRTRLVTYQLARQRTTDDSARDASRDREFVALGAAEDLAMALAVQRGLSSGANEFVQFGLFEGGLIHFHRQLADIIDHAGVAAPASGERS